jgi:hypothetical protein
VKKSEELLPIVIDANVFEHLLNPQENVDKHINQLLAVITSSHQLYIDRGGKIKGEYEVRLEAAINNPEQQDNFEIYLLRFWLKMKEMKIVEADTPQSLREAIKKVIIEVSETIDRCFVETAALSGCDLITNDELHIHNRAKDLKKALKKLGYKKTEIINSLEAKDKFCSKSES